MGVKLLKVLAIEGVGRGESGVWVADHLTVSGIQNVAVVRDTTTFHIILLLFKT